LFRKKNGKQFSIRIEWKSTAIRNGLDGKQPKEERNTQNGYGSCDFALNGFVRHLRKFVDRLACRSADVVA
jgi:hypothetical protein